MMILWRTDREFCCMAVLLQNDFLAHSTFLLCSSAPSSSVGDIYKQTSYQPGENDAASPRAFFATGEPQSITNYLFAPSIPWDLVQR